MEDNRKRAKKKVTVYTKMTDFVKKFNTVVVCDIKDMPANNIHKMRKQLRGIESEVLCGKSSVMDVALAKLDKKKLPSHFSEELVQEFRNILPNRQLCLIFTNKDLGEITKITDQFKLEKQAKVGASSPIEVIIPAGPTGMDASQVEFFQQVRIQTKVVKNQLDIISDSKILSVGQKITLSEINLMNKFGIKPFKHKINIEYVLLKGKKYDAGILAINDESMKKAFEKGLQNIAAFGLASGVSNKASAPHSIANAFRNIMGLALGTQTEIKQIKGLLNAPKTEVKEEKPKEEKKAEPKKDDKKKPEPKPDDDEDVGFGGLF